MKYLSPKIRNLVIAVLVLVVSVFVVTTAWATLTLMDFHSASELAGEDEASSIALESGPKPRTRAPEPSTLALFGSGILGMIISFIRRTYYIAKRVFDVVLAVLAIIFFSPLFLITAIIIKCTSRGPVMFTQERVGKDGDRFTIFKFRTMHVDAEKDTGPVWATEDDSRLIPAGKFLRKAHIDEIPQFFNVLKGEMSIIGPRPERPVFVTRLKKEIPDYSRRLEVKPGITGLAQVWHRYDETIADVKKKIKYDILYIKKICLWTDLRILLRTVRVIFTGEGAR